jgi:DNA-binding response OmpR family regulator
MDHTPFARILLVEDEAILRGLVAMFLRGENFEVIEAPDGLLGVDLHSSRGPFDLVLLDLNLPGLPGVEVCRRIRRIEPSLPVIICSAAILDPHMEALDAMGVRDYLTKPYHPVELLRRIHGHLDGLRHGTQRAARAGGRCGITRLDMDPRPARPHAPSTSSHVLSNPRPID